jgi:sulfite reductase alpha subunit-like flavoprotein
MAMTLASLEAEMRRLQQRLDDVEAAAKRDAGVIAGVWTVNRPFQHTGELFSVFAANPETQAEMPATLQDVIDVLERFGFVA